MKQVASMFTALVLGATGVSQGAMTFSVSGLAGTGATADVTFSYASSSNNYAMITVSITNTTPLSHGGFITGFALNVPSMSGVTFTKIAGDAEGGGVRAISSSSVGPNESGWYAKFDYEDIKSPNDAGRFDFGVLNTSHSQAFITGGTGHGPKIVIGETTTFSLSVKGYGLDDFSNSEFESAFANAFSSGRPVGDFAFAARFQGLNKERCRQESDLAVATQLVPVPLPGAVLMSVLGLGGVFAARRRMV